MNLSEGFCHWKPKKEDIVVETKDVSCDLCSNIGDVLCEYCIRSNYHKRMRDHFKPHLPNKTKDLTWFEAQKAWTDGWEVMTELDPPYEDNWVSFESLKQFTTWQIMSKYQLTGKRR
jgi:hypothetical protein